MNNDWNLLGIKPTHDIKAIKRAYASQSKIHHPEENPEMFTKLLDAYSHATEYAKQYTKNRDIGSSIIQFNSGVYCPTNNQPVDYSINESDIIENQYNEIFTNILDQHDTENEQTTALMIKQIQHILFDYPPHKAKREWRKFFKSKTLSQYRYKPLLFNRLAQMLIHNPQIHPAIYYAICSDILGNCNQVFELMDDSKHLIRQLNYRYTILHQAKMDRKRKRTQIYTYLLLSLNIIAGIFVPVVMGEVIIGLIITAIAYEVGLIYIFIKRKEDINGCFKTERTIFFIGLGIYCVAFLFQYL